MAAFSPALTYFLIVIFIKQINTWSLYAKMPEINEKDFNMRSHLKYEKISKYCSNRDVVCKSNNVNICATKMANHKLIYKDFLNGCYMFLSNMCDHPDEEFVIVTSGSCEEYLSSRRNDDNANETAVIESDDISHDNTTDNIDDSTNVTDADELRRGRTTEFVPLYDVDESYDYHACPYSCPNIYKPECINVNRGRGAYFKLMSFVNHCASDLYYCKHWREFAPPPDDDEFVMSSPLGWSFCASSRYLAFARFSESVSSLSHFGWLAGESKYSSILEPHQRLPGLG